MIICAVISSPNPAEAHDTVTVLLLPVVRSQVQDEIEGAGGHKQIPVVRAEKAVASESPQTPPLMNGK